MGSDKNIKIDITADTSGFSGGVAEAQAQMDKLGRSAGKMAGEYSGLDAATKKMTGSTAAYTANINKLDTELTALLSRINPAYAAVMKLDQGTDLLHQGMKYGLISSEQYASSIGLLESSLVRATAETGNAITMTARSRQEMVVLGREVASGNFSRIPGTLSIIAQGMSPLALGIGAVTVALSVGAYAWYKWGEEGTLASSKVLNKMDEVKRAAEEGAKKSKHMNQVEQLAEIDKEILALEEKHNKTLEELEGKSLVKRMGSQNAMLDKKINILKDTAAAEAQHLENLKRNAQEILDILDQQLARSVAKASKGGAGGGGGASKPPKDTNAEEDFWFAVDEAGYKNRLKTRADADRDYARAVEQANAIIYNLDPIARATHEWEKLLALHEQGLLTEELMGKEYARLMGQTEKTATGMSETWKTFADNTQRTLSDVLYNGMNGQFNNIEEMFKQMLFRMAANAASARLTEGLFGDGTKGNAGLLGAIFSGISGKRASGGPVSGGSTYLVGERGPELFTAPGNGTIVPNHQIAAGGSQIVINDHTVFNVDSRSDRGQMLSDLNGLVDQKQAQLVERLRREGAIA